jgi:hypothetical protein
MDFESFGPMPALMATAGNNERLHADMYAYRNLANYSLKTDNDKLVMLGETEIMNL